MIIETKHIREGFKGFMLFGFIFTKNPEDKEHINHEKIHVRQFLEISLVAALVFGPVAWFVSYWFLLGIPVAFYLWYGIEFLIRLIQYRDTQKAYKNISFEREAYNNEKDFNYLKQRKLFEFLKDLKLKNHV